MLNDRITSFIRTGVPMLVGALLTWLGATAHIILSPESQAYVTTLATFVVSFVYYVVVRAIESHVPQAGVLLGIPSRPVYIPSDAKVIVVDAPPEVH